MGSKCPSCGAGLKGYEVYCPRCGFRVGGGDLDLFAKVYRFLLSPGDVAESVLRYEGVASTVSSLFILALFPALGAMLASLEFVSLLSATISTAYGDVSLFAMRLASAGFLLTYLMTVGAVFLEALIVHVLLGLGGGAPEFRETMAVVVYSESPTLLSGLALSIPFSGTLITFMASLLSTAILGLVVRKALGRSRATTSLIILIVILLHAVALTPLGGLQPWAMRLLRVFSGL